MEELVCSFAKDGFTKKEQEEITNKGMHYYSCGECVASLLYGYFLLFHGKWYNYCGGWKLFCEENKREKVQFT
jgi:hypothetical protein